MQNSEQSNPETVVDLWMLRLYIAGKNLKSLAAVQNLKGICEKHLEHKYSLEIIDLLENPQLAERDKVLAIPTLVRMLPIPARKIIGDLSDREQVLKGLNLLHLEGGGGLGMLTIVDHGQLASRFTTFIPGHSSTQT